MRLIDVDREIQGMRQVIKAHPNNESTNYVFEQLIVGLELAPTVEAEPIRHGEWKTDKLGNALCSGCGALYECGAKMKGG